MSVAIDNTGKSQGGTSVTSVTIASYTIGSGSNRFLFVGVSQFSTTDRVPSAVLRNSSNVTLNTLSVWDAATVVEGGGTRRVTILYCVAPTTVTGGNILVSWSGSVDEAVAGATSWTGVDQTTPLSTAVKSTGTGSSGTTSTVSIPNASGDATHDVLSADAGASAKVSPTQTQRWRAIAGSTTTEGAGQSAAGAGTNISSQWTNIGNGAGSQFKAHIGVAIKQVSAGATRRRIRLCT